MALLTGVGRKMLCDLSPGGQYCNIGVEVEERVLVSKFPSGRFAGPTVVVRRSVGSYRTYRGNFNTGNAVTR